MVYVIGEILVDVFKDGNKEEVFPGGAPFNVASNIAKFNGHSSFIGSIGKDEYGKYLKKYAKKLNLDNLILKTPKNRSTTIALVTLDNGERSFKFIRENGADYVFSINDLKKLPISKGDIVHIGSLMLSFPRGRSYFYKAIDYVKSKGAKISFDVNYRDDIFESASVAKRIFKKAIKSADILKFSDEELAILTNKKRISAALKSLLRDDQLAFVSLGKKGSLVYQGKIIEEVGTLAVKPVDTTGAGDAFYSYVLYSLDNKENNYKEILRKANAVGGIATLQKGATNVVPTLDELDKYLEENNI